MSWGTRLSDWIESNIVQAVRQGKHRFSVSTERNASWRAKATKNTSCHRRHFGESGVSCLSRHQLSTEPSFIEISAQSGLIHCRRVTDDSGYGQYVGFSCIH